MQHIVYTHRGNKWGIPFSLIQKQEIHFEAISQIVELQKERSDLFSIMEHCNDLSLAQIASKQVTQIEYELQDLWGFPLSFSHHRHWKHPGCKCPKIDNADAFPEYYIITGNCDIHRYLLDLNLNDK